MSLLTQFPGVHQLMHFNLWGVVLELCGEWVIKMGSTVVVQWSQTTWVLEINACNSALFYQQHLTLWNWGARSKALSLLPAPGSPPVPRRERSTFPLERGACTEAWSAERAFHHGSEETSQGVSQSESPRPLAKEWRGAFWIGRTLLWSGASPHTRLFVGSRHTARILPGSSQNHRHFLKDHDVPSLELDSEDTRRSRK